MASELRQGASGLKDVPKGPGEVEEQRVTTEESQVSDNDGGERPVRRKLKETSITSIPTNANSIPTAAEESQGGTDSRASSRGRKRSFNEDETEINEDESGHRRKRSRSSNVEEGENEAKLTPPMNTEKGEADTAAKDASSNIMSPRKKRSRDQLDKTEATADKKEAKDVAQDEQSTKKTPAEGEPEKKRHRDDPQEKEQAALPNAFANTSSISPFGSLGSSKPAAQGEDASKKSHVTSNSAFASSSLAAFAGSEQSPFGSLGSSTTSVLKKSSPETKASEKPKTGFAAAAGPSSFASTAPSGFAAMGSGFSGFSGGFGAAAKPSGGLTSFASPGGSSVLNSTSQAKPLGASADDEETQEGAEEGDSGPGEFEEDKTDERFFEREIETGEEEEKTYFSCKAKLFQFSEKEWRERGIGTFKVNVKLINGKEDKKATRMIMRADGVGRVMLNTPLFKGMTVGDASGKEPKSKQIHLASLETGRSMPILLRTGADDNSKELYRVICDLLKEL